MAQQTLVSATGMDTILAALRGETGDLVAQAANHHANTAAAALSAQDTLAQIAAAQSTGLFASVVLTEADLDGSSLSVGDSVLVLRDGNHLLWATVYTWDGSDFSFTYVYSRPPANARFQFAPNLAKSIAEAFQAKNTDGHRVVNVVPLLDSLSLEFPFAFYTFLQAKVGGVNDPFGDQIPLGEVNSNSSYRTPTLFQPVGGTAHENRFDVWPNGNSHVYGPGTYSFGVGGNPTITADNICVAYIRRDGGGTIQAQVGGLDVGQAVDTSVGTAGEVGFIDIPGNSADGATVDVVVTGGDIEYVYAWREFNEGVYCAFHTLLNQGGLGIANATSSPQALANWTALFERIGVDVFTYAGREDHLDLPTALPKLLDCLLIAGADVIMVGNLPIPETQADADAIVAGEEYRDLRARRSNVVMQRVAEAYQAALKNVLFFDVYDQFVMSNDPNSARRYYGQLSQVNQIWNQSGENAQGNVHASYAGMAAFFAPVMAQLSAILPGQGGIEGAPQTRWAGQMGVGSEFVNAQGTSELAITAEELFRCVLEYQNSIAMRDREGNVDFRIAGRLTSDTNVLPENVDLGGAGSGRGWGRSARAGYTAYEYQDAETASGLGLLAIDGLYLERWKAADALAELDDLRAQNMLNGGAVGQVRYISDATNGHKLWVLETGSGGVQYWRSTVDGSNLEAPAPAE